MAQVVVVGGGLGGLAAAVRLQADGHRVTLVEAREALGGRAGQIRERGFTFDTGPTIVTAPDLLTRLWQHAGRSIADDLELIPLRPFYEIRFRDGSRFRYADRSPCTEAGGADVATDATSPRAALEREIMALSPGDLAGYRAFMAATERIYRRAFAQLAGRPFHELRQFVAVVPELLKLGAHRSVYDLAARYFRDERLRVAFSFHPLFIGGNPFRASAIYSIIPFLEQRGGVWYVRGGTYALVCALERLFRALGGEVRTGQPVREIVVRDGWPRGGQIGRRVAGVCLQGGEALPAEIVVSNADVAATLAGLVPAEHRRRDRLRRRPPYSYSMSCFLLYLGLDRQYPALAHHTVLMPRDFRSAVTTIFRGQLDPDDLAVYLHTPTRTDPSLAPPGCESVYALVPVPNLAGTLSWADGGDALRDRTIALLRDELGLADLERHIVVERRLTPLDFRDDLRSHLGAAFSIEPTLWQSAYFRPHNRQSTVPGLYLVGAGTHPGAGIPGVLLSAEITAGLVRDDLAAAG
jgi:phytoene desaturase